MTNLEIYPDAWVLLRPSSAYRTLLNTPTSRWQLFARPLLAAFVLGCAISLMTSGRVSLRLAIPTTLYWTFVPLFEIASLALVCGPSCRKAGWSRTIDLFFMGHSPWSLLLVVYSAIWAFFPPISVFAHLTRSISLTAVSLVIGWSAWIDYCFFRTVLSRTQATALRDLALQRTICWLAVLTWFVGSAGVQEVATRLGL